MGGSVPRSHFQGELEAALRRSDVTPESPSETRAQDEPPIRQRVQEDEVSETARRTARETASESAASDDPGRSQESESRKTEELVDGKTGESKTSKNEAEEKPPSKESQPSEDESGSSSAAAEGKDTTERNKRDELLRHAGKEKALDQEKLAALSVGRKLSAAPKSGEANRPEGGAFDPDAFDPDAPGGAPKEAEPGGAHRGETKAATDARAKSLRRGPDLGSVGKGAAASDLGPREVPRRSSESDGRKGPIPEADGERSGEKESVKGAIRTTVVNRSRSGGESDEGGGQKSGLQDSSGRGEVRFVGETSDSGRSESTGFESGRVSTARPTGSAGSSSSLEGSRDLAPRHLQQQLKDFATGDVVRHARFVLKENAGGEIRLLLKPEQLGTVRVRLEVQDNRIAGRIIVENTTVRDAFEQTLSELHRAFREAGLESGSLEVTVGQDGQASGQRSAAQGRRARAIEELAESVPRIIGELEEPRMINVYA
jgi:flagellar protein FlbC